MWNRVIMAAAMLAASSGLVRAETASVTLPNPPDKAAVTQDAEAPAVTASNGFGIELYRVLGKSAAGENLFISPYSMSVALTMAAEGARGETESEMAQVLHFPTGAAAGERAISRVHEAYAALSRRFREAAGSADPQTRARIDEFRKQLDAANKQTAELESEQAWAKAHESQTQAQKLVAELNGLLTTVDRFDLRVANALWVERSFSLVPDYVRTIDRFYGAGGVTPLNIAGDTEKSRQRINGWVEDNTEHRIKNLIPAGMLPANTRLVITNAVYFKGEWASPFSGGSTKDEDFTLADGKRVRTMMMQDHWRGAVPYAAFSGTGEYFDTPIMVPKEKTQCPQTYPDNAGFSMIELPYKGGELSMVVIAPRSPDGLPDLEAKLSADALDSWLKRLDRRTVDTALPRFKMESEHGMSSALRSMGMRRAFVVPGESGGAQFPGMASSEDPTQQLYIGEVLHKAWVEVTEKGTEAAAATAIMMPTAAPIQRVEMVPFTPQFRADRPFIFLIRDTKSGVVLFIGRLMHPAEP